MFERFYSIRLNIFFCVCFQMDLKLLLISALLGVFCNAQKGKISLSVLIFFKQDWLTDCYNVIILSYHVILLMSACIVDAHFIMMIPSLEKEAGYFSLMMSLTRAKALP